MRTVEAVLEYDSGREDRAPRARGLAGEFRSLLYRAGDVHVEVLAQMDGKGGGALHGQVTIEMDCETGRAMEGTQVRLARETARTDEHGQFALFSPNVSTPQELFVVTWEAEILCRIPAFDD